MEATAVEEEEEVVGLEVVVGEEVHLHPQVMPLEAHQVQDIPIIKRQIKNQL